jgi:glycosyltransferase involved in cell wall biosynthesis
MAAMKEQAMESIPITIILTCFKEGDLLVRAWNSILEQDTEDWFVVLVNDASPDSKTNQICEELSLHPKVTYIRNVKNQGLSGARNVGFSSMSDGIAMPLDADDRLPCNAVSSVRRIFAEHPNAEMVFGNYLKVHVETGIAETVDCSAISTDGQLDFEKLADQWILMGQSACAKSLWTRVGGYKDKFANSVQDVDFWRRAMMIGFEGRYLPELVYEWFRSDQGMNESVKEADYVELRLDSLAFYQKFNPSYGRMVQNYLFRYFEARLERNRLLDLKQKSGGFSFKQNCSLALLHFPKLYVALRKIGLFKYRMVQP